MNEKFIEDATADYINENTYLNSKHEFLKLIVAFASNREKVWSQFCFLKTQWKPLKIIRVDVLNSYWDDVSKVPCTEGYYTNMITNAWSQSVYINRLTLY